MIDSIVLHLEALKQNDFFEEFLVLLEKEKKQGRNYLTLSSIPIALHYRLIQENFTIKRIEKTIRYFLFFKKTVYSFKVEQ
ncbi:MULTISPECIES: hypothetical protein [Myroides]|jgi:hypothetical protein|uniref:Uncharacterized protein n=1 Tax=Myroides odoratus TaxID=256 RepID=A0A9Q7EC76_MYROD|nr:hypothetical protein [Myroides odoratus]EHQ44011.1 hypothetical protein Myrod_3198 [Myroides odoratus DSM 2801]EKB05134.1 hypothetical protein HMPREF9716_02895 [Myroides odoratus CIP 103059]QQU01310.1 hypothetical protein I6I88_06050 [Myroides odoratus]WQD56427.1 hypothetical protein U0010_12965 [Myroides odoratus]STZ31293.1 Uncharacterised protein [Myroides odoratus]